MKVGILSREYPPLTHVGGIATYSAAAARLFADHGHEVHVVCNGPETRVTTEDGVTVHRVAMLEHHFPSARLFYPWRAAYRKHLPHYLDALTWARTAARYIAKAMDFDSFDAWEWPETMGEGALLPHQGPDDKPRRICRIHTGWMDDSADNALERHLLLRLQRRSCENADRVVSPSRHMADHYAPRPLGYRGEVSVNRNPLRLWEEPVDWAVKGPGHLLYVGRVEWRKGLQVLLAALDSLGPAGAGLRLRVVGHRHPPSRAEDKACQDILDRHLAERSSASAVTGYTVEYAGPSPHDGMRKHYDWAEVLVIPSLMENYPYTALEGLSRGCRVVGSEVGGIPEIVDRPERGQLFPAGEAASLARIMGEYRERALGGKSGAPSGGDRYSDLKRNVESMRAEFGPEACYRRLLEGYGETSGERGRNRD